MDAVEVKRSLFNQFKDYKDFVGVGIKERNGKEYVVVKLLHPDAPFKTSIPSTVGDIDVRIEVSGNILAY
ncbi:hypothetical protein CLV24_11727 [Pontibacter ummariensis]|uniref:Uncharacterized protein n=1 Tax=Pontibacter ummariensis TaxID=1610492 RepID=A0A239IFE3_9BACT|nr:hypothetical protein [Pontibacter ummariensis]PRY09823.1 hypothetical protein CLV24_11727 [Pontibacter ummariensis]SNS92277.1 hypothetical protein SAMN06296052_11727 [Pontibacter ummariensis]